MKGISGMLGEFDCLRQAPPVLMDATEKIPGLNLIIEKIQDSISGRFIIDSLMARSY